MTQQGKRETPDEMLARLERATKHIDPPYPRWMSGDNAKLGVCFCRPCAEKEKDSGRGDFIDGGYGHVEEDGCLHCDTCGSLLDYTLTESGVGEELCHFEKRRFRKAPDACELFHITRMVEADKENPRVIRVAERALAALSGSRT